MQARLVRRRSARCANLPCVWTSLRTPKWIGRLVGLLGLLTVISALSPEFGDRVRYVTDVLPRAFPAAATAGAVAVGILLIALSRALRRGKFRAWLVATVLTAITVLLHLVKGLDVEEAIVSTAMLALLVSSRRNFTARPDPRSLAQLGLALLVAPPLATLVGYLSLRLDPDSQRAGTTELQRLAQSVMGLAGFPGPVRFADASDGLTSQLTLAVLGGTTLLVLLLVAMRPAGGPTPIDDEQDARLRALLDRWGHLDSLGYFALRDDRSVIFSKSGKAAVTYRVVGAVSLAAGDPIGDPEAWPGAIDAWLDEARSYGWTPAALGASERGARALHRVGLDALELGDEAIVHVPEFSLEGRSMRVVRQAVSRCARAGLVVSCHRVRDLDESAVAELQHRAEEWRDGAVERGFTMALGRFCRPEDGESVVVVARDAEGQPRGLLNLVPWGSRGLSLDLMRRDRSTENGIVEHMVAALACEAPRLGVDQISLNFAVLRSVFARGEQLGAGPVLRLWHSVLLGLSRFWQIESLYRANLKYQPEWRPRFLSFEDAGDLARVATAALRAEAFLVAPEWVGRLRRHR